MDNFNKKITNKYEFYNTDHSYVTQKLLLDHVHTNTNVRPICVKDEENLYKL